jgi:hypothetical protein
LSQSVPGVMQKVRRPILVALAAFAVMLPMLAVPLPAQAAATTTTRIANFAAGPATVVKGKTISIAGQSQRASGKVWAKTGTVTATVYFDPDGTAPNKAVRTVKSNTAGYVSVAFTATVSGKWSIRLAAQGSLKASASVQKYVKVVPAPKPTSAKPASKWNCPAWAPIKGNAPSRIYHLPGQRFYTRTTPEICFTTEAAARQSGYRKSKV